MRLNTNLEGVSIWKCLRYFSTSIVNSPAKRDVLGQLLVINSTDNCITKLFGFVERLNIFNWDIKHAHLSIDKNLSLKYSRDKSDDS